MRAPTPSCPHLLQPLRNLTEVQQFLEGTPELVPQEFSAEIETPLVFFVTYFLLAHVNPHNSHAAEHPQSERKMSFPECWVKRTGMEMEGEDEEGRAAAGRAHSHVLPISNRPFKPLQFFQYRQFYYKNSLRQNQKIMPNPNIFSKFNMQSLRKRLYKPQMLNNLFAGCGCRALRMC